MGSKPIRSCVLQGKNIFFMCILCHRKFVTIEEYFMHKIMTSCAVHYDVIYHPFPINCQYRIYSINRPGRLLNFWTLRVGAYSRWALIRGWALIKFSPFSASEVCLFCNKTTKSKRLYSLAKS